MHKKVTYKTKNTILNDITQDLNISLIDQGCNSSFLGEDACILSVKDNYFADVIGMNNSKILQAPIGTGCMKINTLQGLIIGIFNQYVTSGKGHIIHSALQMEAFGLKVDDKSCLLPGFNSQQAIITPDWYEIPLSIQGGLAYMDMEYPTDKDLESFPAVFMTTDTEWNPFIYDNYYDLLAQDISETSSETDIFQSTNSQEIVIFETS